ncbi:MAG: hypothetical protein O2968_07655 [Acidobacteria bacterium]|nr:hypothetical protein [Acidobacteriota bacterium]
MNRLRHASLQRAKMGSVASTGGLPSLDLLGTKGVTAALKVEWGGCLAGRNRIPFLAVAS